MGFGSSDIFCDLNDDYNASLFVSGSMSRRGSGLVLRAARCGAGRFQVVIMRAVLEHWPRN